MAVPKVKVPGFFVGGGELQGEKRKESPMDSEHFRRSQAPFPCRKKGTVILGTRPNEICKEIRRQPNYLEIQQELVICYAQAGDAPTGEGEKELSTKKPYQQITYPGESIQVYV